MKDLDKMVVPIDLDKNSQKIVDLGILMATKMGSERTAVERSSAFSTSLEVE